MGVGSFFISSATSLSQVISNEVRECTWLGSPMCAACGGISTWGNTWESRTLPRGLRGGVEAVLHIS